MSKKKNPTAPIAPPSVILELISYNREQYSKTDNRACAELLQLIKPDQVNWINLDGLNLETLEKLQAHFNLHSLLIEDVLNDQRPKAEEFDDYFFFTLKMLYRIDEFDIAHAPIRVVVGSNYL